MASKLANIRFATYLILLVAVYLYGRRLVVIPLSLMGGPTGIANDAARSANLTFVEEANIFECRLSGKEVLDISQKTLTEHGYHSSLASIPRVRLRSVKKGAFVMPTISWILRYETIDPAPGSPNSVSVVVDDYTKKVSIEVPQTMPNQSSEPTPASGTSPAGQEPRLP
jgi:hypothetical protein